MKQERKTERSFLFMIAAGIVCQTNSHGWYGWCIAMLTLLATGAQGQGMDTPWEPNGRTMEDTIAIVEIASLKTLVSRDLPRTIHSAKRPNTVWSKQNRAYYS